MCQYINLNARVNLSDYNYREPLVHRLFIAQLSNFELEVLREILNLSIQFPTVELAQALDTDCETVIPVVEKLEESGLLQLQGATISVDKERRRFYSLQIERYDNQTPGFDFAFAALRLVPMQVLLNWYAIPCATDDIMLSIAEQILWTPKIYENYLAKLTFVDSRIAEILKDVFRSPDLCVVSSFLREKYALSREMFEEYLLILEFHLACCVGYRCIDGRWESVITPFREWRDYLLMRRKHNWSPVEQTQKIDSTCDTDFSFVKDMNALLKAIEQMPLPLEQSTEGSCLSVASAITWLPNLHRSLSVDPSIHLKQLLDRLLYLGLCHVQSGTLRLNPVAARDWQRLSYQDQALTLYRIPLKDLKLKSPIAELLTDRLVRDIERATRPAIGRGWIPLDSFLRSLEVAIGSSAAVTIKRTGKRWRYETPDYSSAELEGLSWVVWQRLFECGMTDRGLYGSSRCFRMTSFGKLMLG